MPGWWTPDRQAYAVNYLVNGGLSIYGAAGLVSRWANVESIAAGPTAVNPYSGAFGIAQWLGARKAGIRGNTNLDAQLLYVLQELSGAEARAGQVLKSAQDAGTAAVGASMYERAEGYSAGSGRDNFTSRTAAGVPMVIASYTSRGAPIIETASTPPLTPDDYENTPVVYNAPLYDNSGIVATEADRQAQAAIGPLLLLGVAGLFLYLVVD